MIDFEKLPHFLDVLFDRLRQNGIDYTGMELDHVCYRVETQERYADIRAWYMQHTHLLSEAIIGGRPICTFKLRTPVLYGERKIDVLELPSPKEGRFYAEGFEHFELVCGQHPKDFIQKYPQLDFDERGLKKAINADVRLQYPEGSVKFHEHSLEYVIEYLD